MTRALGEKNTTHKKLVSWIDEMAKLCEPAKVFWCDGSEMENKRLCDLMIESGTFTPLKKRPGCYLARSHPSDVARVEDRTFICARTAEEAGPTNHWADPGAMKEKLMGLFKGCM
ncbi:MAG: phosphoenolpyruvate carboxykinase, partial [Verrucomicrobia bacterium]|nr:phosphoenolpyruvate carboxykinase [Verrucomicrobiota bacterium]